VANTERLQYAHPDGSPLLEAPMACPSYQEQWMRNGAGDRGYCLARLTLLTPCHGQEEAREMVAQRKRFVEGAATTKMDEARLPTKSLRHDGEVCGLTAFNKSHAAAYALIGIKTGYLKRITRGNSSQAFP